MYPAQIKKELEKLHDQYMENIEALAKKVMVDKVQHCLVDKGLSLTCMNGFIQCYNEAGDQVELPKVISNLLDIQAPCGYYFSWSLPEFNPFDQNFSDLDIENFNKRIENLEENEAILSCWQTMHRF